MAASWEFAKVYPMDAVYDTPEEVPRGREFFALPCRPASADTMPHYSDKASL